MDRSGASSRLSVSRRPVSAGAWTGVSSTSAGSAARHVSATSYRKPYVLDASARPTDELSATKIEEEIRQCQEEIVKKDQLLSKLSRVSARKVPTSYLTNALPSDMSTTDVGAKTDNLQLQLNEMRSQLELRDSQIHELKRLYRESREAEARNAEVVQQLRVELASHHNIGMIDTNCGDLQRQNRELQDHITQLQSQLRMCRDDLERTEQELIKSNQHYDVLVSELTSMLHTDDYNASVNSVKHKVEAVMAQNVSLRDKLIKMKDYLVTAESEQQANRHKMIDMINEQSNIAQLTDNLDILTQERDAALCRQRELVSEISDLKSQLNTLKSTCDELRLKTKRQEHEDKDGVDEESRVLKEKIAELMSDGYVTVAPRQHSIIKHLKLLTDNVRSHNMEMSEVQRQADDEAVMRHDAERRAKHAELMIIDLEERLQRVDELLQQRDQEQHQLMNNHKQYISCVEHIARAAGVTVTDEGLNIEEATQLIVDRVEQLYDINSQDKQSLIHTLQLKLKSLKERLQLKEQEADDLRHKLTAMEQQQAASSDELTSKSYKLHKKVDKYKRELTDAQNDMSALRSQLEQKERQCESRDSDITRLEAQCHDHVVKMEAISDERQSLASQLRELSRRQRKLSELRHVMSSMLGLRVTSDSSSLADYELVTRLEKLILANQANMASSLPVDNAFSDVATAYRHRLDNSPTRRHQRDEQKRHDNDDDDDDSGSDADVPDSTRSSEGHSAIARSRSRSLSPVMTRDHNIY